MELIGKRWANMCRGKRQFGSPKQAGQILRRMVERNDLNLYDFCIYPCPYCTHWHLGKMRYIWMDRTPDDDAADTPDESEEAQR